MGATLYNSWPGEKPGIPFNASCKGWHYVKNIETNTVIKAYWHTYPFCFWSIPGCIFPLYTVDDLSSWVYIGPCLSNRKE
jgi:hypothetical protein